MKDSYFSLDRERDRLLRFSFLSRSRSLDFLPKKTVCLFRKYFRSCRNVVFGLDLNEQSAIANLVLSLPVMTVFTHGRLSKW